jgi:DNA-nicking Smr family endonuclease
MKKRTVSEEEKSLFRKVVEHTRPKLVAAKTRKIPTNGKAGGTGLDGNTRKKMQRGGLEPSARLDLHGYTQEAAHRALLSFLRGSHKRGARLTLVITGKGNPKKEGAKEGGGVLKTMVPRWLHQPEFSALIAAIEPAHISHGGAGALYVYLRK